MTIGRPLNFDPDIALEKAMHLFWQKGYESSSLQALINTMGLSKSSFYQTFKSKHQLFQTCIQHYQQMLTDDLRDQLEKSGSGKTFITTLFNSITNETCGPNARRGCLLMNTASEFAQSDKQVSQLVSSSIERCIDIFELAVQQGQQQEEISKKQEARALATYLLSSMSGLKNMVKAGADKATVKQIVGVVLTTLD
jgi:TetR/AcrR family transcriptional repressor of nem operon